MPNPREDGARGLARPLPHRAYGEAVLTATADDVLVVSRGAVLDTGRRAVAYVDRGGGAYERRDVRVGRRGDTKVEILSGLSPGENVVSQGNLMIDAESQMAQPDALGADTLAAQPASGGDMARWKTLSDAAAALALDDLDMFNKLGLAKAGSLADARRAFHEVVTPVVQEALRHPGAVKVYECPMTSGAFPGAPASARWIQMAGPLRNPWFGREMSDCGTEVNP